MYSNSFIYLLERERERERKRNKSKIFRVLCSVKWFELAPFEHDFHVQVFLVYLCTRKRTETFLHFVHKDRVLTYCQKTVKICVSFFGI